MKYIQTLINVAVGTALLALGSSSVAQSVKPCIVTVVRIQGEARYSLGDNAWHPLVVGKILRSGAIIQSAADSKVDIVLSGSAIAMPQAGSMPSPIGYAPDPNVRGLASSKPLVQQNVIRMFGNTVLAVDKLTDFDTGVETVSDTEIDLRAGHIFLNVKKMSAASQFIIKFPNGVAGIRGSALDAFSTGKIIQYSGQTVEATGNGQTFPINAGQEFDPGTGQVSNASAGDLSMGGSLIVSVPNLFTLENNSYANPNQSGETYINFGSVK